MTPQVKWHTVDDWYCDKIVEKVLNCEANKNFGLRIKENHINCQHSNKIIGENGLEHAGNEFNKKTTTTRKLNKNQKRKKNSEEIIVAIFIYLNCYFDSKETKNQMNFLNFVGSSFIYARYDLFTYVAIQFSTIKTFSLNYESLHGCVIPARISSNI